LVTAEIGRKRVGEGLVGLPFLVRVEYRRKGIVERLAGFFFFLFKI
jgi:hypothetical protein